MSSKDRPAGVQFATPSSPIERGGLDAETGVMQIGAVGFSERQRERA